MRDINTERHFNHETCAPNTELSLLPAREREKQTGEMEETGYRERQTQKRDGRGDWVSDREEREE